MGNWLRRMAPYVENVEVRFDRFKAHVGKRFADKTPYQIVSYLGFGTPEKVFIKGRILQNEVVALAEDSDTLWENILNMYRRFESDEVPQARVRIQFQGETQEVLTSEEGFFDVWMPLKTPVPSDSSWHEAKLELLEPIRDGMPVLSTASVLVPPPAARFGVISDLDDTVIQTNAAHAIRMVKTVFLGNARTRLPFPGVSEFYSALNRGTADGAGNPVFYVSSSPWNLYDLLVDFFRVQNIPLGPLFLRDWGITSTEILPTGHRAHKMLSIEQILQTYSTLPFLLIGDSGQEDPEIYREVVKLYPGRILGVCIRNVSRSQKRADALVSVAEEIEDAGSVMIVAKDTRALTQHATEKGWIEKTM